MQLTWKALCQRNPQVIYLNIATTVAKRKKELMSDTPVLQQSTSETPKASRKRVMSVPKTRVKAIKSAVSRMGIPSLAVHLLGGRRNPRQNG